MIGLQAVGIEGHARRRVAAAGAFLVAWYAVALVGPLLGSLAPQVDRLVNRDGRHPEGFVEQLEALAWFAAVVLLAIRTVRGARARGRIEPWMAALALLALLALGEEVSWGQHLFHWRAPEAISRVNLQHETNLHNLDPGALFGLPASAVGRALAHLASRSVTFGFISMSYGLWVVLPTLAERGRLRRWPRLASIPVPLAATRWLAVGALAVFLVADRIVDVGELLELSLAVIALLVALDLRERPAPVTP